MRFKMLMLFKGRAWRIFLRIEIMLLKSNDHWDQLGFPGMPENFVRFDHYCNHLKKESGIFLKFPLKKLCLLRPSKVTRVASHGFKITLYVSTTVAA